MKKETRTIKHFEETFDQYLDDGWYMRTSLEKMRYIDCFIQGATLPGYLKDNNKI
jgi:hypothetical protein